MQQAGQVVVVLWVAGCRGFLLFVFVCLFVFKWFLAMHYTEVSALFLPQVALSSLGFPWECLRRTSTQVYFCYVCTIQAFGCLCQQKRQVTAA